MTPWLASRRIKRAVFACALALAVTFSELAFAAIKVTSVDGASRTDNINTTNTETPVIFGGVTGSAASAFPTGVNCTGTGLCDTCAASTAAINGGSPLACNRTAVSPTTEITIRFTAGKAGFPILMNEEKTTVIAEGTASVAAGSTAEIITTWDKICDAIDGMSTTCDPQSAPEVDTDTFFIGVTKDDDNGVDDTDDESSQITFTVSDSMGLTNNDLAPISCTDATAVGAIAICDYSIQSGDEKAVLTDLGKTGAFPTIDGINISAMRVMFEQCTWGPGVNLAGFDTISPASNYVDLEITTDSSGVPELVENEIDGLTNGLTYCTKIGHVDQAGNVGLFTPNNGDENCQSIYLKDSSGADFPQSCHVARPDEVLGVMAESCFIATAAYGSPWKNNVQTFRDFRNKFLLSNKVGRQIVKFYYRHSKAYAKQIAKSNTARAITRGALSPIWLFARVSLKIGILATTLLTFALFASPFAFLAYRRKQTKAVG